MSSVRADIARILAELDHVIGAADEEGEVGQALLGASEELGRAQRLIDGEPVAPTRLSVACDELEDPLREARWELGDPPPRPRLALVE